MSGCLPINHSIHPPWPETTVSPRWRVAHPLSCREAVLEPTIRDACTVYRMYMQVMDELRPKGEFMFFAAHDLALYKLGQSSRRSHDVALCKVIS